MIDALACDKLRFLSSVLSDGKKTEFIQKRNYYLSQIQEENNEVLSLAPTYLMAFSLEEADKKINSACLEIDYNNEDWLPYLYFALHGLMTYRYEQQVQQIKERLISFPYNNESAEAKALLAEIFLLG